MRKILFSITFLFLTIILVKNDVNAQSINPYSLIHKGISLFSVNQQSNEDVDEEDQKIQKPNGIEKNTKELDSDNLVKNPASPSSTRISIGIGKALFEKYIK